MAAAVFDTVTMSPSASLPLSSASNASSAVISLVMDATSRRSSAFFSKMTVPVDTSAKITAGDDTVTGTFSSSGAAFA